MKKDGPGRVFDGSDYPLEIGTEAGWAEHSDKPLKDVNDLYIGGGCCCGNIEFEIDMDQCEYK